MKNYIYTIIYTICIYIFKTIYKIIYIQYIYVYTFSEHNVALVIFKSLSVAFSS